MNYKPHEFARIVGVSVKTLQRWDAQGKLPAKRTPSKGLPKNKLIKKT